MIIYRPNRETLPEAMAEAKEFESADEMRDYIVRGYETVWERKLFDVEDIVICGPAVSDPRNGWVDTQYVCVTRMDSVIPDIPYCIGFCATEYATKSKEETP